MLTKQLELLKPLLAKVAQDVFERWVEWPCGCCDAIAQDMAVLIFNELPHVEILDGGQEGDDHAWLIVHDGMTACGVDIPHYYYERGGGYNWQPLNDVQLDETCLAIWTIPITDILEDDND